MLHSLCTLYDLVKCCVFKERISFASLLAGQSCSICCPCDALLARYRYLSVSVCVRYKSEFCQSGWTDRANFWHIGAFFDLSYAVFSGNSGISKNKVTFLWNSWLGKFRHGTSIVAACCQQRSSTVELCWPHLRRSTRRGSNVRALHTRRANCLLHVRRP